jgi:hypothetical protein
MGREITIKRAFSNAETGADMLHRARAGLVELERHSKRLGINGFASPAFPATPPRTRQSRQSPFPYEIAFEFCKRPCDPVLPTAALDFYSRFRYIRPLISTPDM